MTKLLRMTCLAASVAATATVTLSNANVRDCTTSGGGELTCGTDVTSVPTYNVQGTNGQVVRVIKTASALTGSNGGPTMAFRPTGPDTVTLTNSGAPGSNFTIGGEIDIATGTLDGTFTGAINVTVDY